MRRSAVTIHAFVGVLASRKSAFSRRAAALLTLAGLLVIALPAALASAAPPPQYTVAVSPVSVVAGSTGNTLTFQFTASAATDNPVMVHIPPAPGGLPWSAPQSSNPAGAGYLAASKLTCKSASVSSVTGAATGPWAITVNPRCQRVGDTFALAYRGVTAPTKAARYAFTTFAVVGSAKVPLVSQPAVTVLPAAAAQLTLSGQASATAGVPQPAMVTALDAFGNVASSYGGTVHFTSTDAQAALPGDYTFTAADAGAHTFTNAVTLKTATSQTVTVTDTAVSTLTASQTVAVTPGPATHIMLGGVTSVSVVIGQTVNVHVPLIAADAYNNPTNWNGLAGVTLCVPGLEAQSGCGDLFETSINFVNGQGTIDVNNVTFTSVGFGTVDGLTFAKDGLDLVIQTTSALPSGVLDYRVWGISPDAQLNLTLNPDGRYSGTIAASGVTLDASTITLDVTQLTPNSANGTSTASFSAVTTSGQQVSGTATVTSPVDVATGTLVSGSTPAGPPLTVSSCINGQTVTPGLTPTGSQPCPSGFSNVTTTNPTPIVVIPRTAPGFVTARVIG